MNQQQTSSELESASVTKKKKLASVSEDAANNLGFSDVEIEEDDDMVLLPDGDSSQPTGRKEQQQQEPVKKQRKTMQPRAKVWDHFTKFTSPDGEKKSKCNYCPKEYMSDPKRHGTTALKTHLGVCPGYMPNIDRKQKILEFKRGVMGEEGEGKGNTLGSWKFDQDYIRNGIAYMLIVDELPFSFVENIGFIEVLRRACPWFSMPSRRTITRDCYQLYLDERTKLKMLIKRSSDRISLTTDTWTSIQRINYMCVTAHFIDNDWKLNKKIINFCQIASHKGESIGRAIEKCLSEWGIQKVMTITVDNATSNDSAISFLKERSSNRGSDILGGRFMHMRCVAHIINLVVVDGLKEVSDSVARVRGAVRFVRQSPSRLAKFKQCVLDENIEDKRSLCLDVSTRWNSTYLMLDVALKMQRAFEKYDEEDPHYALDLAPTSEEIMNGKDKGKGKPEWRDWENVKRIVKFLEHFYHLTIRVSGSLYVTSNNYFQETSNIYCLLKELMNSCDIDLSKMASRMKKKYDKYWADVDKINFLMHVAVILDPRHKLQYVKYALMKLHEGDLGREMGMRAEKALYDLFGEFKRVNSPSEAQCESSSNSNTSLKGKQQMAVDREPQMQLKFRITDMWLQEMNEQEGEDDKSELDTYLAEAREKYNENFKILDWWKVNSPRFPILSKMARSILAVPISTVASESAFSTGGRVLDDFRSSLTPKMVQALLCSQDWLRASIQKINIEEDFAELENIEKDFTTTIPVDT